MEKKSIMIIGAGPNQLHLIRSAQEAGYYTVAVDPNEQAPGKDLADRFCCLPPADFDAHCEVIERYGIRGIVTTQMDKPLQFMARLAEKYGFPFISRESADWARNKYQMKQRFLQEGVPCAAGVLLTDNSDQIEAQIASLDFPLIMKPVDAYSSRGVFVINRPEELREHFEATAGFSTDGSVLVEAYIPGKMISVEGFVCAGEPNVVQYTERFKFTPKPLRVELGHIQPATLAIAEREQVDEVLRGAVRALRLDHCGFHAELKLNAEGVFMIEIGARLGGDFNASHLVPLSTGINLEKIVAQIAMGDPPALPPRRDGFAMIKWLELQEGKKIQRLPDIRALAADDPGLAAAAITLAPDSVVPRITDSSKRAGYIVLQGVDREEIVRRALRLEKAIQENIAYYA